jgi:hypothetical protein
VRVSALSKLAEDHIEPILPPNIISIAGCSKASPKSITNESVVLLPTHIKHYKTTAPTDMRKHQLERLQNKKQRKMAKKQKRADVNSSKTQIMQSNSLNE